uniref:Uncharacterized protein n=1 Tax=Schistocephalus solidus TaxID=70667 RepID=A0A0X3PNY3_SCHSO
MMSGVYLSTNGYPRPQIRTAQWIFYVSNRDRKPKFEEQLPFVEPGLKLTPSSTLSSGWQCQIAGNKTELLRWMTKNALKPPQSFFWDSPGYHCNVSAPNVDCPICGEVDVANSSSCRQLPSVFAHLPRAQPKICNRIEGLTCQMHDTHESQGR